MMIEHIKRLLYISYSICLRTWWRMRGGRVLTVFGSCYRVEWNTVFPMHRRLRLPKGNWRSEIVRYADFVQMHACCQYLAGLQQPTVVDVGAHHGAYAIVLGKIAKERGGKLIAIEPHPENFKVLQKNVAMNGLDSTVSLDNVAVTEERCVVGLDLHGSESCVVRRGMPSSVDVSGEPLAAVLERHGVSAVDLLIVDVEGAELPVLQSFPWDEMSIGRIFCELHPYNWAAFNYEGRDFQEFLAERRLKCLDMYLTEHPFFRGREYLGPCLLFRDE